MNKKKLLSLIQQRENTKLDFKLKIDFSSENYNNYILKLLYFLLIATCYSRPPFVRPIHRERPLFSADLLLSCGPWDELSQSSIVLWSHFAQQAQQKSCWRHPFGSSGWSDYREFCMAHNHEGHPSIADPAW